MDSRTIPVYRYAMFPVILSPPVPPWSPASLPGLVAAPNVALARSLGYLWQDAGKTVPAVADGDPVRVMTDPFAPSIDWTAPSDAARPLLKTDSGKWYLLGDGVDDYLSTSDAAVVAAINATHTVAAAWRRNSGTTWPSVVGCDTYKALSFGPSDASKPGVNSTGSATSSGSITIANGTDSTFIVRGTITGTAYAATILVDGVSGGSLSFGSNALATTAVRLLNSTWDSGGPQSDPLNGRIYGAPIYSRQLSDAESTLLQAYLRALMP